MHTIKTPSIFKPSSRPSSPALQAPTAIPPSSSAQIERARPLSKLSLSPFRKGSPAPSSPGGVIAPAPLVQDGSYLETLSLKLSEAVSKALAQPPSTANAAGELLAGKRPIPPGRGKAFGAFVAAELNAAKDNQHLRRAIIRSLQRPLSVLLNNISAHLVPLLSTLGVFNVVLTPTSPNLTPTQAHAIGLATLAGEVAESLDALNLGVDNDPRNDGLRAVREGLVNVVGRVVNPLVTSVQTELLPIIDRLEVPNVTKDAQGRKVKSASLLHPSIVTLQGVMPMYAKALGRITCTKVAQSVLAAAVIGFVWHGMVALAHRVPLPPTPPSSPGMGLKPKPRTPSMGVMSAVAMTHTITPPMSPPSARFGAKLPPSRPPSPPVSASGNLADSRALSEILVALPRPEKEKLASEAVDEAFEGLAAFVALLELIQANPTSVNIDEFERATEDLPTLISLPVILRAYCGEGVRTVAEMLGMEETEYRDKCLSGFNRADDCEEAVGAHVIRVLRECGREAGGPILVSGWLDRQIR